MLSALAIVVAVPLAASPVRATLADAAFIAGRWVHGEGAELSEEVWTAAGGDGMLGMWRAVSGGTTRVVELLAIEEAAGTLTLRVRHFDPHLVAREERERPLVLPLVSMSRGALRFEGPRVDGGAGPVALTYRKTEDGLEVTLEKDGKARPFRFRRG